MAERVLVLAQAISRDISAKLNTNVNVTKYGDTETSLRLFLTLIQNLNQLPNPKL